MDSVLMDSMYTGRLLTDHAMLTWGADGFGADGFYGNWGTLDRSCYADLGCGWILW